MPCLSTGSFFMSKFSRTILILTVIVLAPHYLLKDEIKMVDIYRKVKVFNETFGVKLLNEPAAQIEGAFLNYKLMKEENEEYLEAVLDDDKVEVFDALLDQLTVLFGNFQKHGFSYELIEKGMEEVYRSNMSKLDNGKVKKRDDGKILKGKHYFKPNLKDILLKAEKNGGKQIKEE